MSRLAVLLLAAGALALAPLASGQKEPPAPKPETYLCPDSNATQAVDCFLNAVSHLYTMCRQVKSIEIIEFGYEKSDEGTNGAKSEYCVDKHKASMSPRYQAALKEAKSNKLAVENLQALHEFWLKSLHDLKWKKGETDEDYKARIAKPYEVFRAQGVAVKTAMVTTAKPKTAAPAKAAAPKAASAASPPKGATSKGSTPSKGTN